MAADIASNRAAKALISSPGGVRCEGPSADTGSVVVHRSNKRGASLTLGVGAAYRVWRGLEFGIGIDNFRGSPKNVATLYSGSLELRFGAN